MSPDLPPSAPLQHHRQVYCTVYSVQCAVCTVPAGTVRQFCLRRIGAQLRIRSREWRNHVRGDKLYVRIMMIRSWWKVNLHPVYRSQQPRHDAGDPGGVVAAHRSAAHHPPAPLLQSAGPAIRGQGGLASTHSCYAFVRYFSDLQL